MMKSTSFALACLALPELSGGIPRCPTSLGGFETTKWSNQLMNGTPLSSVFRRCKQLQPRKLETSIRGGIRDLVALDRLVQSLHAFILATTWSAQFALGKCSQARQLDRRRSLARKCSQLLRAYEPHAQRIRLHCIALHCTALHCIALSQHKVGLIDLLPMNNRGGWKLDQTAGIQVSRSARNPRMPSNPEPQAATFCWSTAAIHSRATTRAPATADLKAIKNCNLHYCMIQHIFICIVLF